MVTKTPEVQKVELTPTPTPIVKATPAPKRVVEDEVDLERDMS
jgi:hypothetical protein